MFKPLIPLVYVSLILWVFALCCCTQSDDVIFNETDTDYVSVNAYFSVSQDSSTISVKTDTIRPGDSIIFMSSVYPSKSIRNKGYYWTMDGEFFAYEYNSRKAIAKPGHHEFNFVFIDYFGDTLRDTLDLYVGSAPILDSTAFIPATGTQYISPDNILNFAWNAYDPDSIWNLSHHFILQEAKAYHGNPKILVDTILDEANFTYFKGLSPLGIYEWSVIVENNLAQVSKETIHGLLSTKGILGEGAIYGFVKHSSSEKDLPVLLTLINSKGASVYSDTLPTTKSSSFAFKPLDAGKYKLISKVMGLPDFNVDTTEFEIKQDQILMQDTIFLQDIVPPQFYTLDGKDTTNYADTLKFIIKDLGGSIQEKRIKVLLDGETDISFKFRNDTLLTTIPELKNSWTYRIITIATYDYSGNKGQKNLYIRPNKTLTEVTSE